MSDWNAFLLAQGAHTGLQNTVDFSLHDITTGMTYLMPLPQQGLLAVNGPDAAKFLQGQITCDVRELENNTTRLGAQCNIKGRMLLCFRALQTQSEQIVLRMHRDLVGKGMTSFGKYIVFSKATLADLSQDFHCVGIAGSQACQIVEDTFGIQLSTDDDWSYAGQHIVIRINENRFECWLALIDAKTIWAQLATRCEKVSQHAWTLLNIQAGLGDITQETYETFTPQAINLQLVNGINFRKGCYTGQEIVARLHYRGSLKRHMYRFEFALTGDGANSELPAPGSELRNDDGKVIGEVVMAAKKNSDTGELLASVVDDQRIDVFLPNNPQKLSLLSLPYAIPTQDVAG